MARRAWHVVAGGGSSSAAHPDLVRTSATRWTFRLDGTAAHDAAARGRRLARAGGLRVTVPDGTTKIEVALDFEPVDQSAAAVFAVEHAVEQLLAIASPSPADLSAATVKACAFYGLRAGAVDEKAVRDRLWQRGHYLLIYRLRSAEDFSYA